MITTTVYDGSTSLNRHLKDDNCWSKDPVKSWFSSTQHARNTHSQKSDHFNISKLSTPSTTGSICDFRSKCNKQQKQQKKQQQEPIPGKKYEHVTCNISIKKEYYTSWDPKRVNTHMQKKNRTKHEKLWSKQSDMAKLTEGQWIKNKRHTRKCIRLAPWFRKTMPPIMCPSMPPITKTSGNVNQNNLKVGWIWHLVRWYQKHQWYYFHKTKRLLFSTSTDVPNNFVVIHEFQFLKGTLVAIHKKHTSDMEIRRATLPKKIL